MNNNHRSQIEINDLIGDAVTNAIARRNQVDSEFSALSNEQVKSIAGGIKIISSYTTTGILNSKMYKKRKLL